MPSPAKVPRIHFLNALRIKGSFLRKYIFHKRERVCIFMEESVREELPAN